MSESKEAENLASSRIQTVTNNQQKTQSEKLVNDIQNIGNSSDTSLEKAQNVAAPEPTPDVFPDGGRDAWLCIAGGFCAVFSSFGWINCIGVFQDYYQTHQLANYSPGEVAWIPSVESFMLFFFGLAAGKLTDSYGPRWPLVFGSFMHVFGLMMTSISQKYYQIFLAQSVCSAIGCSFLFYPSIAAAGTWFKRHRALAFGIMVSGSSLGGIVLPIMVDHLVREVGFGWAMRITAFLILGLLGFGNVAIKSRLAPAPKSFSFKEYVEPFLETPYLLLAIGSFMLYLGAFLPFNFIIVQAKEAGMSTSLSSYLVPIINAASTFGRIVPSHFGDLYGIFNICVIFTIFSAVISLAVWLPVTSNAGIIVYAVLYGFSSGLTLSIIPALVASISDVKKLGIRTGILFAVSSFGVLFGSPIAGAIVDAQGGSFSGLKIFCGVTIFTGGVFFACSRVRLVGPKLLVKR